MDSSQSASLIKSELRKRFRSEREFHLSECSWQHLLDSKENIMNEGHAHIYINGNKNRVYSEWYHIEDEKLTQPINQIRATLNANDHSEYTVNSRPIEAIGAIKNENIGNWYNNKK